MTKAVRYDEFRGIEVLRVGAAGINPGEAAIRTGAMADIFPSTSTSGQGSDLAGVVAEVGVGVDRFSVGDERSRLARRAGATVIGLASQYNHEWLRNHDCYTPGQHTRYSA